ncbi:MAG TPA: hypothetical protein ENH13_02705 [Euryarchaeota archaeon]|nr:hypothetical protein [Euryarchaeota archaeon]
MVEVEKALRNSLGLYRKNPAFVLPHLIETVLTLLVFLSTAVTVVMAIGVHFSDALLEEDPTLFISQIASAGMGLITIIILSFLFTLFLFALIKAGAIAGVVGMAKKGFSGEKASLGSGFVATKKYTVDILLFWIFIGLIYSASMVLAFVPSVVISALGMPEGLVLGATILMFLLLFIPGVVFYVLIMFAPQFIVVEGGGMLAGVKKSIAFVKENSGAVLIYIAIVFIFSFFVFGGLGILSLLPDLFRNASPFIATALDILFFILRLSVGIIIAPYFEIVKTWMIAEEKTEPVTG